MRFAPRRRGSWAKDALPTDLREEVITALEMRKWIRRRYAEIDSIVFDLLRAANPQKTDNAGARHQDASRQRLAVLRALAAPGSYLAQHQRLIAALTDRLEGMGELLNLVIHGFVEVRENRAGHVTLRFELGRKRRDLTVDELRSAAATMNAIVQSAAPRLTMLLRDFT